jgi:hypothetical protein
MLGAARYYDAQQDGLGNEFLDEIALVIGRIKASPVLIAPFAGDFRSRLLSRFPYGLVYRLNGDDALIIAVAHHARRQGYWTRRASRA